MAGESKGGGTDWMYNQGQKVDQVGILDIIIYKVQTLFSSSLHCTLIRQDAIGLTAFFSTN